MATYAVIWTRRTPQTARVPYTCDSLINACTEFDRLVQAAPHREYDLVRVRDGRLLRQHAPQREKGRGVPHSENVTGHEGDR